MTRRLPGSESDDRLASTLRGFVACAAGEAALDLGGELPRCEALGAGGAVDPGDTRVLAATLTGPE